MILACTSNCACEKKNACKFLASEFLGTKPSFYKETVANACQETAPNACQRVSKPHWKNLAKSSLQFLSASFHVPECYCIGLLQLLRGHVVVPKRDQAPLGVPAVEGPSPQVVAKCVREPPPAVHSAFGPCAIVCHKAVAPVQDPRALEA